MALSEDEIKKLIKALKQQAEEQQKVNSGLEGYLDGLKKIKALNKTIATNAKIEADIRNKMLEEFKKGNRVAARLEYEKLGILRKQNKELKDHANRLKAIVKDADKYKITMSAALGGAVKNFGKIPKLVNASFGKIKGFGLFEMDKAIRMSALEMGLLSRQSKSYQSTIRDAAMQTANLGVDVKELAKIQSDYSEELGRSVMLGKEGLISISEIAKATTLGAEGAAKMAADFENQGLSAKRTRDLIENTLNDSTKLGLNASKVVKNISNNVKMLNKYSFKKGAKGLAEMAETASKLGVDMEFASGFAEKLFSVEGAIDMSAQLQVLGGGFAKLADPFRLMYMARNDMKGLTEEIGNAAAASAHFNKETGQFDLSTKEMFRLRILAEQTGIAYDDLVTAGKNAAKFARIKTQISFTGLNKEEQDFLMNTAQLNEQGKAYIEIDGKPKLLSQLGASGANLIKTQLSEKKTLEERIKMSQNFEDSLNNLIMMVKVALLPVVDGINDVLKPLADKLLTDKSFQNQLKYLGKGIGEFVKMGAGVVKWFAELAVWLGPKGTLATILGFKALGWLIDKGTWIANGLLLAQGFMAGTKGTGLLGGIGGAMGSTLGKVGGAIGGAGIGFGAGTAIGGGGKNAMIGSAIGTGLGALGYLIPGFGLIAGPALMALGGMAGGYIGGMNDETHDGLFNAPIHDGVATSPIENKSNIDTKKLSTEILSKSYPKLGSDFSKQRGVLQGGKITPIDNKDDLLAMKKGGVIDKEIGKTKSSSKIKHEFSDLNINGEIRLTAPGSPGISENILKDPKIRAEVTAMILNQIERNRNGGKIRG